MSKPADARNEPAVLPDADSPNSLTHAQDTQSDSSDDDDCDSIRDSIKLFGTQLDLLSLLELYDDKVDDNPYHQGPFRRGVSRRPLSRDYYKNWMHMFGRLCFNRHVKRQKEEILHRTRQESEFSADDAEDVRPSEQGRSDMAETTPKPAEHTSDNADAKKEVDKAYEEVVAAQDDAQFVETTEEDAKEKNNATSNKKTRSTIKEEDGVAAEVAAPATALDQDESAGQKRKSNADDTESVRPAKQRKSNMAEKAPNPSGHTANNADMKKEVEKIREELVIAQNNAQFVETNNEDAEERNKEKEMNSNKGAQSTITEEDEAVTEAAAATMELY